MRVRKAVITAAGANQRSLPLQTMIHDGTEKSVLGILIEQALNANVGEICVVVWPGDETRYAQAAGNVAGAVRFVPQQQPRGYGHAIYCAREFIRDEPFLHMVGDHLYISASISCVQRLVDLAQAESCSASGCPAHPGKPLASIWRRRRTPHDWKARLVSGGDGHRKAHSDGGRTTPHDSRNPGRILPLFLRYPRSHTHGNGPARAHAEK